MPSPTAPRRFLIALVSAAVPPSSSGQAKVIERLIKDRPNADFVLLTDAQQSWTPPSGYISARYHRLRFQTYGLTMRRLPRQLQSFNLRLGAMRPVRERAAEIVKILRPMRPDLIIGCSGNPLDLPASAVAAERLSIPFFAYLFDDPLYQVAPPPEGNVLQRFEKIWAGKASKIICPNERLSDDVRARTGHAAVIVRNPHDNPQIRLGERTAMGLPYRIVYTGSVYEAQRDSLLRLSKVLEKSPGRYRFDIYTPQTPEQVEAMGIVGTDIKYHSVCDDKTIAEVQAEADVLFLPLSFESNIQAVLMSSSPGKMAEYLAAGTPILVHAPPDSYLSDFFRSTETGLVVDQPDVSCLERGLNQLIAGGDSTVRMQTHARAKSEEFASGPARELFWDLITSELSRWTGPRSVPERRILLVGIEDAQTVRYADQLARTCYAGLLSIASSSQTAEMFWPDAGMIALSANAPCPPVDPQPKFAGDGSLLALFRRTLRNAARSFSDPTWTLDRVLHGPVATVGRSALPRNTLSRFEFRAVCTDEMQTAASDFQLPANVVEDIANSLEGAIETFRPEIVHSLDALAAQVVAEAKSRKGETFPLWIATQWPGSGQARVAQAVREADNCAPHSLATQAHENLPVGDVMRFQLPARAAVGRQAHDMYAVLLCQ